MTNELLYCIILTDASEATGAAAEFLGALYENISTWRDEETKVVKHTLYFLTDEEGRTAFESITNALPEWASFGVVLKEPVYTTLKRENWAESWKLHFKTVIASERLVIKPSWEKFVPDEKQIVITLDPGMSFGTGRHATTKSCLAAIDAFAREANGKTLSFLDAGSGSGILAIAAKKLGYTPVAAFDIDPDTIPVAIENATVNALAVDAIDFQAASLEGYETDMKFDVIAANILSSALVSGRESLLKLSKKGGKIILAGILATEYPLVKSKFEEIGCRELTNTREGEWEGGTFIVE